MSKQFDAFLNDENESVLTVEQLQKFSKAEQEQVKQWCLRDTWFFAQRVMRAPNSLPLQPCHRDFCYSLVQPNPDAPIQQWDATKERALLCFRGFGKTTLSQFHIAQCILSFPDMRILLVGGVVAHAVRKMHAIVDLFNYSPVIEHLFPKFTNAAVKQGAFTTPARTLNIREATISCGSFRSTNASGHYELVSCDDAANDANQGTVTAVEKSLVKFDDLAPLVEPACYIDYIGVRTDANDIPAQMSARSIQNGTPLVWLKQPVFQLKEGVTKDKLKLNLATDVDFAWPQRWNEKTLQRVYALPNFLENYLLEIFEAEPESEVKPVTPELLNSCITNSVDYLGDVACINADLSMIHPTRGSDYCGIVGGFWNPTTKILTVNRILHRKFTDESDFLRQTSVFYRDYCLSLFRIRFRVEANRDEQQLYEKSFNKQQMSAEFLPSIGGKYERVATLWDAIRAGKIKFDDELSKTPDWQTLVNQVCYFSGTERQHDDAVDSLAQLWEYANTITEAEPSLNVPDFGDEVIQPFACRPCDMVKIRRPDAIQPQNVEYSDAAYGRMFSVSKYKNTSL